MSQKWYFKKNNLEVGPVDSQILISLSESGRVTKKTQVRLEGSKKWHPASDIEGLFIDELKSDHSQNTNVPQEAAPPSQALHGSQAQGQYHATITQSIPTDLVVCPHCWEKFSIEDMHYISRHSDLRGDPVLGTEEQLRFLPSRFTSDGHAFDANGMVCPDMACKKCHLRIPESVVDIKSIFFSIVGAPASGKSYFMTSMIWQARKILPSTFNYSFTDADAVINLIVNGYEQLLYLNSLAPGIVALPKTELQGSLYHQITLNNMIINLPMPFIFQLQPMTTHDDFESKGSALTRNVLFYDNAGEHFQPGADSTTNPATKHLVHSNGIIFLFDPSKDARMREKCNPDDPQVYDASKLCNQETLLAEMISRIRRYKGMKATEKYPNTLVVAVAKYDMWKNLLTDNISTINPWVYNEDEMTYSLDYNIIANVSYHVREILLQVSPEIVATSESFALKVLFIPESSLGHAPERDDSSGIIGVRPDTITPIWAEVPLLILLASQGFISATKNTSAEGVKIEKYKIVNDTIIFLVPGFPERIQLPSPYLGCRLFHKDSNQWILLPSGTKDEKTRSVEEDNFWVK